MDIIDTDLVNSSLPAKGPPAEPNVIIDWSLEPTTHSYNSDSSPTVKLSLTIHSDRPITIYKEHIDPSTILAEGRLSIFDHTTNTEVDQIKTRYCSIPPPSKVHVPLREQLFHTLYPDVPVTFTTSFGRSKTPSRPKSIDTEDGPGKNNQARGVHGLEPGHHYSLRPGKGMGLYSLVGVRGEGGGDESTGGQIGWTRSHVRSSEGAASGFPCRCCGSASH